MKNSAAITKEGNTYLKTRSSVGVLGTAQRILLYVRIESRMVLKKRHLYTVSLFLESIIVACGLRVDFSRSGSLPLLYSDYLIFGEPGRSVSAKSVSGKRFGSFR